MQMPFVEMQREVLHTVPLRECVEERIPMDAGSRASLLGHRDEVFEAVRYKFLPRK